MKKKRKYNFQFQENKLFVPLNFIFGIVLITTVAFSFVDIYVWQIDWGKSNAIDVLCEIIATTTLFVGSVIGIAIPLQREKLYGISSQDFNKLRGKYRYSVTLIIVLSVVLSVLNGIFLVLGMTFACFGVSAISVLFCIYVSFLEVPFMMGQEKSLIKTLKKYVHLNLNNNERLSAEGQEVLKHLICCEKTLKETYALLKEDDDEFNKRLIIELLDIQEQQAYDLNKIEDKEKQRKIASALRANIRDVLNFNFDLTEFFKGNTKKYSYRITRVLFRLAELPEFSKETRDLLVNTIINYDYVETLDKKDFIMSVALPMLLISVTSGDFVFAKAMRRLLFEDEIILNETNSLSLIVSIMSLHFYYLCNGAQDVSDELKTKIYDFMNFDGIEEDTKINPWRNLVLRHTEEYKLSFAELLRCYELSGNYWDVWLRNSGAHFVVLSTEYVLQWYLTCLLHSYSIWNFDFKNLLINDEIKRIIKTLGDKIYPDKVNPRLTDQMQSMAKFYDLRKDAFEYFIIYEDQNHKFFNVINDLHLEDLEKKQRETQNVKIDEIIEKYNKGITNNIVHEWGFDARLEITSEPRYMHLLLEKYSESDSYNNAVVRSVTNAIYRELSRQVPKTIIVRNEHYDSQIGELLNKNKPIIAVSQNIRYSVGFYIKNEQTRDKFNSAIDDSKKISSKIFVGDYIFTDNAFSFNIQTKLQWRELSPEEISAKTDFYKRADGQYIFEGALIAREKLEAYIKGQYYILSVELNYAINAVSNSIYKIDLYPIDNDSDGEK